MKPMRHLFTLLGAGTLASLVCLVNAVAEESYLGATSKFQQGVESNPGQSTATVYQIKMLASVPNMPMIEVNAAVATGRTRVPLGQDQRWRLAQYDDEGSINGPVRSDYTLAPGKSLTIEILAAGGETMDIEARLKRDSGMADLDLIVRNELGSVIFEQTGPLTGHIGAGLYLAWVPEICARYDVEILNVGHDTASFALFTARAIKQDC